MLQIYLDFSAYSDMAIGMGQMIGFHYKENFDYPYCSKSVGEFWRRWHMTLGRFFTRYVYISLQQLRKIDHKRQVVKKTIPWRIPTAPVNQVCQLLECVKTDSHRQQDLQRRKVRMEYHV